MAFFVICLIAVVVCAIGFFSSREAEEERKKQEKQPWKSVSAESEERAKRLGYFAKSIKYRELTKPGQYGTILVYTDAKTIVINNWEYKFSEIIDCRLEKGATTYVTTPNQYEMAREQVLWGMGQRYNVSTQTQVLQQPDKVCITVNRISNSLIVITPAEQQKALEINSMINVIIRNNQQHH